MKRIRCPRFGLSLRAPWWLAILRWGKRRENRDWAYLPKYRGPLALFASQWFDAEEIADLVRGLREQGLVPESQGPINLQHFKTGRRGGIVGAMDLVGTEWNKCAKCDSRRSCEECRPADPWAVLGAAGLLVDNAVETEFVPATGALGIFEIGACGGCGRIGPLEFHDKRTRVGAKVLRCRCGSMTPEGMPLPELTVPNEPISYWEAPRSRNG